jgi:hypothetical protein
MGHAVQHPLGEDAIHGAVLPAISNRLARLRRAAPFAECRWTDLTVQQQGRRVELGLVDPEGGRATFYISKEPEGVRAGYDLGGDSPSEDLVAGLAAIMRALSPPQVAARPLAT